MISSLAADPAMSAYQPSKYRAEGAAGVTTRSV
jgi:hypothetical protein